MYMRTEMRLSPLFFFLSSLCLSLPVVVVAGFFLCVHFSTDKIPSKKKGGEKMELIVNGYRVNTFFFS